MSGIFLKCLALKYWSMILVSGRRSHLFVSNRWWNLALTTNRIFQKGHIITWKKTYDEICSDLYQYSGSCIEHPKRTQACPSFNSSATCGRQEKNHLTHLNLLLFSMCQDVGIVNHQRAVDICNKASCPSEAHHSQVYSVFGIIWHWRGHSSSRWCSIRCCGGSLWCKAMWCLVKIFGTGH